MSANPIKDINLNSDAVPFEDQEEISGVIVTESSVADGVPASEAPIEGGIDQVRVSCGGEDPVEPLIQGSDIHAEENLKEEVTVPVASISINGRGDENEGDRFDASLLQKVSSVDEESKPGTEVIVVEECSMKITESLVEQNRVGVEGEVAAMQEEEVFNLSCLENKQSSEVDTSKNGVVDAVSSVNIEPFPNSDLKRFSTAINPDTSENITYSQDEKQEAISQVDEMGSHHVDGDQRLDLNSVEKNPNGPPCGAVDSDSVAEIMKGDTETIRPLQDLNLDSEAQAVEECSSLPHEDQNMGTCDSQLDTSLGQENQNMEVDIKIDTAGGSCKQDENEISVSHVSEARPIQLCENESNMGSLVVDLNTYSGSAEIWSTGDEDAKEDTCIPDESCIKEVGSDINDNTVDDATDVSHDGDQKIEATEQISLIEQLENVEKQAVHQASLNHGNASEKENQASQCLETEEEDEFTVSDLVWGKVKSHPWWPGQIFDPSDSSEYAKKYHKNDRFLVAYFGDQTFAWNEASSLKPFEPHFSQMEKQTNLKAFRDAVDCALDEVSRQAELGLSCSCTPEDAYAKIKSQIVKNAGIREEVCRRNVVDVSRSVTSFEPVKLVEYIKAVALCAHGGSDRLEFVIAQAQLRAFYRSKGYFQLPEFQVFGGLLENDAEPETPVYKKEEQAPSGKRKLQSRDSSSHKRRPISGDGLNPRRKERRLSELMDGKHYSPHGVNGVKNVANKNVASKSASPSSGKKHKGVDFFSNNSAVQSRKQMLFPSKNSDTESPTHKVGERIRRIASQLTRSPQVLKSSDERFQKRAVKVDQRNKKRPGVDVSAHTLEGPRKRRIIIPKEYSSPDEMLSQLCLAARDPMKGYSFLTTIVGFFTDFRNSISLDHSSSGKVKQSMKKFRGVRTDPRSREPSNSMTSSAETYNYGNDSYWTDRIIQSSPEEQELLPTATFESKNSLELNSTFDPKECNPIVDLKQQSPDGKNSLVIGKPVDDNMIKEYTGDFSPTALILNFTDADSIPSEMDLNKIFSPFGLLKESETEVLRKVRRAKVVFERRNDAEAAFSSAGKFSTFGPALISYQLKYLSSAVSKASPHDATQSRKGATSLEGNTS